MYHYQKIGPNRASTYKTGTQGNNAAKVFSTVHHVIKSHLEKHPHITHLHFSADNSEPSRVKLYRKLAKRFATSSHHEHETEDDDGEGNAERLTHFAVPVRK